MKLGAPKKPIIPKTKEQKEKEQQQQQQPENQQAHPINQEEDIEKLTSDILKIYGNQFAKDDIINELKKANLNKSVAISNLVKQKEQIEQLEEKLAAQKIQSVQATSNNQNRTQFRSSEMQDFYGYQSHKSNLHKIEIPINLLQEIVENFKNPRPAE